MKWNVLLVSLFSLFMAVGCNQGAEFSAGSDVKAKTKSDTDLANCIVGKSPEECAKGTDDPEDKDVTDDSDCVGEECPTVDCEEGDLDCENETDTDSDTDDDTDTDTDNDAPSDCILGKDCTDNPPDSDIGDCESSGDYDVCEPTTPPVCTGANQNACDDDEPTGPWQSGV
jgi:clumping factor A